MIAYLLVYLLFFDKNLIKIKLEEFFRLLELTKT